MAEAVTYAIGDHEVQFSTGVVPERVSKAIFVLERPHLKQFLDAIRPDDVVYDIGAMFGLYAGFAGKAVTDGAVYAFEPYPKNVEALEETVALNSLSAVETREVALSDTSERREFETPSPTEYLPSRVRPEDIEPPASRSDAARQAGRREQRQSRNEIDITTSTFVADARCGDNLVAAGEIAPPNVVKIDVEGAEHLVVDGLQETLDREECRLLFCELHPPNDREETGSLADFGSSVEAISADIEALGFDVELTTRMEQQFLVGSKEQSTETRQ